MGVRGKVIGNHLLWLLLLLVLDFDNRRLNLDFRLSNHIVRFLAIYNVFLAVVAEDNFCSGDFDPELSCSFGDS